MVGANPSPTPVGDASKHVASKLASSPAPGPVEVAPIDRPLPSIAATIDRTVARLSPVRSNCWKHGKAMTPSRWERTVEPSASTGSRGAAAGAAWASECAPKCGLTPREKARPDAKWCESTCAPTQTAPRSEAESGARLGDPVRGGASKRVKGLALRAKRGVHKPFGGRSPAGGRREAAPVTRHAKGPRRRVPSAALKQAGEGT
jgi:hypothetical protein